MNPIFSPGDQKIFRSPVEPRHPRIVNWIYLVLLLAAAALGVLCLVFGQIVGGVILIVVGLGFSALILNHEISEWRMVRRMRKRGKQAQ